MDAYVATADFREVPQRRTAIVAPHAGLIYSGPVAAFAYAAVCGVRYRAVVLVGPSHFVAFHGVSIWPSGAWDTPMGPVAVDEDLAEAIMAASPIVAVRASAHAREHSLEMQMPFLARLMPGVPIVPLVMGHQDRETAEELGVLSARFSPCTPGRAVSSPRHRPTPAMECCSSRAAISRTSRTRDVPRRSTMSSSGTSNRSIRMA